ncbi:amino acid permease [Plantactinospora siamensis]|uniref:Amino acid permease n=1 Tax=Plantactinospora siamensis TaxID=555372 RepID=A0ABV6NYN4_9ACTN
MRERPAGDVGDRALRQTIGLGQGVALYVCAILGAGVLVLPGQSASLAGPASLVAWAFSALLGIPLAFTFAALASRYPDAGGVAVYASRAFGPLAGGIAGWWYFVAGSVGQTIVPLTAGYYLTEALGLDQRLAPAFAAVVLGVAVAANLTGMRVGARVQIALAVGVGTVLLVVIAVAVPQFDPARLSPSNAFIASVSRLGFALARDGWAPRRLSRVNRSGVPAAAVIAVGGIALAGLAGSWLFGWGTEDIVFVPATLVLTTYLIGAAAALRLLRQANRTMAAVALLALLAATPFAGWHLVVPVAIAAAVIAGHHRGLGHGAPGRDR